MVARSICGVGLGVGHRGDRADFDHVEAKEVFGDRGVRRRGVERVDKPLVGEGALAGLEVMDALLQDTDRLLEQSALVVNHDVLRRTELLGSGGGSGGRDVGGHVGVGVGDAALDADLVGGLEVAVL